MSELYFMTHSPKVIVPRGAGWLSTARAGYSRGGLIIPSDVAHGMAG